MIQRIQTVYLLIIAILATCTFFLPVATIYDPAELLLYPLSYKGFTVTIDGITETIVHTWMLTIISAIIPIIALITIFLYKKRVLQIRLSFINMVLMLGYYGILFIYLWQAAKQWDAEWSLNIVAAFPLVCIILNYLAIRAIGKDQALIKSLNRLR